MNKLKTAIFFTLLFTTTCNIVYAQRSKSCPKFYMGLSTGLENPVGLIGVSFDVPLNGQCSFGGGGGISSWGYKMAGEGRFYFGKCNKSWAFGAGASYSTGLNSFPTDVTVISSGTATKQQMKIELKPCANAFVSVYHFWEMGRNNNRFYLQAGYSHRITKDAYDFNNTNLVLSHESIKAMDVLAPGGLIVALGFSIALVR